jgi:hypothetical protein
MRSPRDSLIHEAAALFRLVDSIDRFVAEHQNSFSYTDSTENFFRGIRTEADTAKQRISAIVQESKKKPGDIETRYRPELLILRNRWRLRHTYIKPASDAHTLSLPVPLISLATTHLRRVLGERMDIVILLTPELMYYHNLPRTSVGRNLVFVEVPYSQGPGLFTNLIIYHELGHFVFDKQRADRGNGAFTQLARVMKTAFDKRLSRIPKASDKAWAKRVLKAWTVEVFCDLFALRFVGPAYTFALIDFLSLIGQGTTDVIFDEEHPAPALRLRAQIERLKRDRWWDAVANLPSDHVRLSKELASKQNYEFVVSEKRVPRFIDAFLEILPQIHLLVNELTPDPRPVARDFKDQREQIEKCYSAGVVPSHLLRHGGTESPLPVSIINAAYCFYLTSMPKLMDKIGEDPGKLDKRSELTAKLESWTLKALEDCQLYASRKKGD